METNYLCPHCRGILNIKGDIILSAQNSKNEVGLLLMHPEIGNYTMTKNATFELEFGEKITFYCPICHGCLDTQKHNNLANLLLVSVDRKESFVVFSKIYGEKATYHIKDKKVLSYGEHCKKYADPEWFL